MRTFEQQILRIRFFEPERCRYVLLMITFHQEKWCVLQQCSFNPCSRDATLCDSIYTGKKMIMQRVNCRSLPNFPVLNSGHLVWTTLIRVSCFLIFPRPRLERQSQWCELCQLNPARNLKCFHGDLFQIFNRRVWPCTAWDEQARAILKTLLSQV